MKKYIYIFYGGIAYWKCLNICAIKLVVASLHFIIHSRIQWRQLPTLVLHYEDDVRKMAVSPFPFSGSVYGSANCQKEKTKETRGNFIEISFFFPHNMTTNARSQPSEKQSQMDSVIKKPTHQLKRNKQKYCVQSIISLISCSSTLNILDKTVTEPHPGCMTCMIQ